MERGRSWTRVNTSQGICKPAARRLAKSGRLMALEPTEARTKVEERRSCPYEGGGAVLDLPHVGVWYERPPALRHGERNRENKGRWSRGKGRAGVHAREREHAGEHVQGKLHHASPRSQLPGHMLPASVYALAGPLLLERHLVAGGVGQQVDAVGCE